MGLISSKTTGSRKQRYENLSKFVCTDGGDELKIQIRRHICKSRSWVSARKLESRECCGGPNISGRRSGEVGAEDRGIDGRMHIYAWC